MDIIDITANSYAEVSFAGNKTLTVIPSAGTFTKATVESAAFQIAMFNFSFSDGKVIYQGNEKLFKASILALVSHEGESSEREIRITIFKNGIPVSEIFGKVSSSGNFGFKAISFNAEISVTNGDYLEAMISNANGTEGITVKDLRLMIR